MEEIGKALKSIFDKLSDFFDIFDLSFFVSGVATTLAILFWLQKRSIITVSDLKIDGFVIIAILICYINGLISFAAGRWIRMGLGGWIKSWFRKGLNQYDTFETTLTRIIESHGLAQKTLFKEYLSRNQLRGAWRLYVRLWAVIREKEKYSSSLSVLKRYWVMAATYDGLSISLMIVIMLFLDLWIGIIGDPIAIHLYFAIFLLLIVLFFFFACIREANRYLTYQLEEVIGTIAAGEDSV